MYGDTAVVSSSAAWIQQFRQVIESSLKGPDGTQQVIWRPAVALLQLEGHNVAEQHAQGNLEASLCYNLGPLQTQGNFSLT